MALTCMKVVKPKSAESILALIRAVQGIKIGVGDDSMEGYVEKPKYSKGPLKPQTHTEPARGCEDRAKFVEGIEAICVTVESSSAMFQPLLAAPE